MSEKPLPCPFAAYALVKVPEWARPLYVGVVMGTESRLAPTPAGARPDGAWTWFITIDFGKGRGVGVFEMRHVKHVDPISALALIR